jgi:hypothetical protein
MGLSPCLSFQAEKPQEKGDENDDIEDLLLPFFPPEEIPDEQAGDVGR